MQVTNRRSYFPLGNLYHPTLLNILQIQPESILQSQNIYLNNNSRQIYLYNFVPSLLLLLLLLFLNLDVKIIKFFLLWYRFDNTKWLLVVLTQKNNELLFINVLFYDSMKSMVGILYFNTFHTYNSSPNLPEPSPKMSSYTERPV